MLFFQKGNEDWAIKRKKIAYSILDKGRLEKMLDLLKDKLQGMITKWSEDIAKSPEKMTVIDLEHVFMDLFTREINHICFGEDVTDTMLVDMQFRLRIGGFERRTLNLPKAIHEHDNAIFEQAFTKWVNPIYIMARKLTGIKNFTKH